MFGRIITNFMKFRSILAVTLGALLLASCASIENINYFQDAQKFNISVPVQPSMITIQPKDQVFIFVKCSDVELTTLFNLPYVTQRLGQTTGSSASAASYPNGIVGYTVDQTGYIDFPVLGRIRIQGLTREQTADFIKNALISRELALDPVVTVDFANLSVAVLGDVKAPGRYFIDRDDFTILDAIARAGDLNITGIREKVIVLRMEDNVQKSYFVDLTSAQSLYTSPVYYLQQNDVVVVNPNDKRARESTVNGNNVRSSSFWISIASLAASVATLIIRTL